jgi:hypothetical protein
LHSVSPRGLDRNEQPILDDEPARDLFAGHLQPPYCEAVFRNADFEGNTDRYAGVGLRENADSERVLARPDRSRRDGVSEVRHALHYTNDHSRRQVGTSLSPKKETVARYVRNARICSAKSGTASRHFSRSNLFVWRVTPAGRLLLFGVAGVNLCRFPHLAVIGDGTGKIRSMALKSEAELGVAGLW